MDTVIDLSHVYLHFRWTFSELILKWKAGFLLQVKFFVENVTGNIQIKSASMSSF